MNRTLRLCLVGCGHLGRIRTHAVLAYAHPVSLAVADVSQEASARLAADLGVPTIDLAEALAGEFDAVILASSAPAHLDQLVALSAGPATVFCEKPLAVSLDAAEAAWPALSRLSGRFQVGFNRRFDPLHRRLHDAIAAGSVGRVEQIRIVSRDHVPPRPDGLRNSAGIIAETSIHDLDKARWLIGEAFADVACVAGAVVNPAYGDVGHDDTVTIVLTAESGAQVIIQNGWRAAFGYDQRVEVFGAKGELRLPNLPPAVGTADPPREDLASEPATLDGWAERYRDSFLAETHAFLDCVRTGTVPAPGLDDALAAQRLVEAARRAAATGHRIPIPGLPDAARPARG